MLEVAKIGVVIIAIGVVIRFSVLSDERPGDFIICCAAVLLGAGFFLLL